MAGSSRHSVALAPPPSSSQTPLASAFLLSSFPPQPQNTITVQHHSSRPPTCFTETLRFSYSAGATATVCARASASHPSLIYTHPLHTNKVEKPIKIATPKQSFVAREPSIQNGHETFTTAPVPPRPAFTRAQKQSPPEYEFIVNMNNTYRGSPYPSASGSTTHTSINGLSVLFPSTSLGTHYAIPRISRRRETEFTVIGRRVLTRAQ
ncbi:hypothetical protein COCVIDRAFT_10898 [Bipolaris victoriae FI3]|uniref:Uncharacterized protein n=1 Tax=Bipolaris victoriae (strain FI3) TaxID=930091 RepID=W7F4G2_BIPV3|nr:hypothetical protein COCVIDRAFT_10898 [Bipolaris victoriae FI3]